MRWQVHSSPVMFSIETPVNTDQVKVNTFGSGVRRYLNNIRNRIAVKLNKRSTLLHGVAIVCCFLLFLAYLHYIYLGPKITRIDQQIAKLDTDHNKKFLDLNSKFPVSRSVQRCKLAGCIEEIESIIRAYLKRVPGLNSTNFSQLLRAELTQIYNNGRAARQILANSLFNKNLAGTDDPLPSLLFGDNLLLSVEQSAHMKIMVEEQFGIIGQKQRSKRSGKLTRRQKKSVPFKILKHNTTINYLIDGAFPENVKQIIREALADISSKTYLRFVQFDKPWLNRIGNISMPTALLFDSGSTGLPFTCFTSLGVFDGGLSALFDAAWVGSFSLNGTAFQKSYSNPDNRGGSIVYLGQDWCRTKDSVIRETLHALGLLREHQRPDRDEYIIIQQQNLKADIESTIGFYQNFVKCTNCKVYSTPFNYRSIMLYSAIEPQYSKLGSDCMTSGLYRLNPKHQPKSHDIQEKILCQKATTLTMLDAATISQMYFGKFNQCDFSEFSPCDPNATCIASQSGFAPQCKCKTNFVGNGITKMIDITNLAYLTEIYLTAEGCIPNGCKGSNPLKCTQVHTHCIHEDIRKGPECICDNLYTRNDKGECKATNVDAVLDIFNKECKYVSQLGNSINDLGKRQICPQGFEAVVAKDKSIYACYGHLFYNRVNLEEAEYQCRLFGQNCSLIDADARIALDWVLSHKPPVECWVKKNYGTCYTIDNNRESIERRNCTDYKPCFSCQCAPQKVSINLSLVPNCTIY